MELIIALTVTLTAGMIAYQVAPLPAGQWNKELGKVLDQADDAPLLPFWRGMLTALGPVVKFTPVGWAKTVGGQLYWAQLVGKWPGWALPELIALHVALAGVGLIVGGLVGGDAVTAALSVGALPFAFNIIFLRAPARRARQQLAAELPEFVSMLAAEAGAGTNLSEALVRLARGPGVCSTWFARAVKRQGTGRVFTTPGGLEGGLRAEALASGVSDLIGLAASLDSAYRRGTGLRELLSQIAASTASRYIGQAQMRAEKVGSEIILPMIFFFFFPYIVILMLVMAAPLLSGGLF